ncbi:solute carrier family 23 protein [Zavarzinia aquatilis]|uniref:Xanthine/uracil permease n=1 Tax=Zavarzinia aquatilis TaxID=2211142 RepID=A0A317EC57_9PROT|nr:solute carrier family 23 protein [Zavarzinia aquatilis]PWR24202.1 xanthine/uracil permease [Zavarzinia aquatilis]
MRRPDTLLYWLEEIPPPRFAFGLALQQVAFLGALMGVPAVFARGAGMDAAAFQNLAACGLIYSAVALLLQAWGRFGIGAGIFLPVQGTTSVLPVLGLGLAHTGLGGGFGMFAVSGLSMILFSYLIKRLRAIFTVEIAGLAMLLIGAGIGIIGLKLIFSGPAEGPPEPGRAAVAGATLAVMIACNVWGRGGLKLFATVTGLGCGLALSALAGMLTPVDLATFDAAALLRLPTLQQFGWHFDGAAVIPAVITGFSLSLTSMGVQTVAQRFNDADFKRPDLDSVGRGVRAEGIAQVFASLINAMPMAASGGAASLALASGCTSRHLAIWTAGLLFLVALCPKIIVAWMIVPPEVLGALFLFLSSFATVGGIQMIGSRMLDNRRTLAIGIALLVGLTYADIHDQLERLWPGAQYIAFSQFALALTIAVLLQALFRVGIQRRTRRSFAVADTHFEDMIAFIEAQGRLWGARHEVVKKAELACWQAFELLRDSELLAPEAGTIELETRQDEFNLTIFIRYRGALPVLATHPPGHQEMLEDSEAPRRMAGYLINRLADNARTRKAGAAAELRLDFRD